MSTNSDEEINESFEYFDESELSFGDKEAKKSVDEEIKTSGVELPIILNEMKNIRIENQKLKVDNAEIKGKLDEILRLLKSKSTSESIVSREPFSRIQAVVSKRFVIADEDTNIENISLGNELRSEFPIELEINGEWKLVESKNVDEFLVSQRDIFPFEVSRIRHSNICFEVEQYELRTCNQLNGRLNLETHFFGFENADKVVFYVKNNKLISEQKRKNAGGEAEEVFSRIERFIEDGKLRVIWERNGFVCERIYKKLEDWSSETNPFDNSHR
uniref:Uncharacterized protein n=1 Tax=Caenorhabditis tropicalis TaxID=1561998 RepID=A0A1I7TSS9_9PELO